MSTTTSYTIAAAADATSTTVDTLRYYERVGVMPPVRRDGGGRRIYDDDDLGWIRFVRRLRATGMPLERVADYTRMVRAGEGTVQQRRTMLEEHRDTIDRAIAELEVARRALTSKIEHYAAAERGEQLDCDDVRLDTATTIS
ncbi:MAG: MerR family transcriptional regulator [Ilumatobacter sp.]|uniref:MerR family transcriptional regulator n=1 Tax=Ilumatobacter sp. TaxID=1967498 RepID=UPI00391DBFB5